MGDHHVDQLLEAHLGLPTEFRPCLRRVTDEEVNFGRTEELPILTHVIAPVTQPNLREGGLEKLFH